MQKLSVAPILPDSLTQVALGGMNTNEDPMCALSERFRPDRCERRFHGLAVLAGCQQVLSERLEGMESQLIPAVSL